MKIKFMVACAFLALAQAPLTAGTGAQYLIKQRAKDVRDQNNAQQGVPARQTTPPAVQPHTAPVAAVPLVATPAQQSLARFNADLAAIKEGSKLDGAQKQKLVRDLSGAAQGAKPASGTVERFVTSVHAAISVKPLVAAKRAKLIQDIDAILNPSKYPQAKMDAIFEDVRSIFQGNGTSGMEASDIAATARVMAAEVRK